MILVNGVDWTTKFTVAAQSASYAVTAADTLHAGNLIIAASIADQSGQVGSTTRSYQVFPTLQAIAPSTVNPGDTITISALGLDPAGTNQLLVAQLFDDQPLNVELQAVDPSAGTGTIVIPAEAASGNVFLEVNGKQAPQSLPLSVRTSPYTMCGTPNRIFALANGDLLVQAYSRSWPATCPTLSPSVIPDDVVLRLGKDGTVTIVKQVPRIYSSQPRIWSLALDKAGNPAILIAAEGGTGGFTVEVHYNSRVTTVVLPPPPQVFYHWTIGPADFDSEGNLYFPDVICTSPGGLCSTSARSLYRIPYVSLASGGTGQLENVMPMPTAWPSWTDLRISCDDFLYAVHSPWIAYGQPETFIGKLDLRTLTVVREEHSVDAADSYSLALTCNADEFLFDAYTAPTFVGVHIWRSAPGGALQVIDTIPNEDGPTELVVMPDGAIYGYIPGLYADGRDVGLVKLRPTVSLNGNATALPYPCPAKPIQILSKTTRWKPQRDTTLAIDVSFSGPKGLTNATLAISDPTNAPVVGANLSPAQVVGPIDANNDEYKITWSGPWTADDGTGTQVPLARGNYRVVVSAVWQGRPEQSDPNDPNSTVSLVEVTSVAFEADTGAPDIDDNPAVPSVTGQNPPQGRLAEGKRVFAEATSSSGLAFKQVKVIRVSHDLPSTTVLPRFRRNLKFDPGFTEAIQQLADGRDPGNGSRPEFWTAYIQNAFQEDPFAVISNTPTFTSDGDSNDEFDLDAALGLTPSFSDTHGSLLFLETMRDVGASQPARCGSFADIATETIPHELGDQFGISIHEPLRRGV